MLKLLVSSVDDSVLGVHVFGTGATELVHIGQMLMAAAAPSTTWSTRCSTTRRWPSRTRWRRSTR